MDRQPPAAGAETPVAVHIRETPEEEHILENPGLAHILELRDGQERRTRQAHDKPDPPRSRDGVRIRENAQSREKAG